MLYHRTVTLMHELNIIYLTPVLCSWLKALFPNLGRFPNDQEIFAVINCQEYHK